MLLKRRLDAAQHSACNLFCRLFYLDDLEPSGQRRVFLEILLVLRPGGCGDGAQFAASKRRLKQVGRIVLPGLTARADHGVRFVDEENNLLG